MDKEDGKLKESIRSIISEYEYLFKKKDEENKSLRKRISDLEEKHRVELKRKGQWGELTGLSVGVFCGTALAALVMIFTDDMNIIFTVATVASLIIFFASLPYQN
ncbi:MAG: hypothetical protein NTZ65_02640 [Candidatus Berkelbacteria bacterium]|nr:hypothetical protein [Candidatus Berkelbacteria bacterium]